MRLYTIEEAAEALHSSVTRKVIYNAISRGELKARKIGRRFLITEEALDEYVRCPESESPQDSTSDQTMDGGSFETVEPRSTRGRAASAALKLLKQQG